MKYLMELTADEMRALGETMRIVRKGGDAQIVARSRPAVSLARKVEELRTAGGLHAAREADIRRVTTLLPPPPSTNVVASTTLADFE